MLEFRTCPRCQGDLYLKRDYYGTYKECIQCGYSKDLKPEQRRTFTAESLKGKVGRPRKSASKRKAA